MTAKSCPNNYFYSFNNAAMETVIFKLAVKMSVKMNCKTQLILLRGLEDWHRFTRFNDQE